MRGAYFCSSITAEPALHCGRLGFQAGVKISCTLLVSTFAGRVFIRHHHLEAHAAVGLLVAPATGWQYAAGLCPMAHLVSCHGAINDMWCRRRARALPLPMARRARTAATAALPVTIAAPRPTAGMATGGATTTRPPGLDWAGDGSGDSYVPGAFASGDRSQDASRGGGDRRG